MQKEKTTTIETQSESGNKRNRTVWLAKMGLLVGISVIFGFIHFPILPTAPFLEYEFSDIPILIGGFAFGPVSGAIIAVLAILLQDLIGGASSGPWGMLMHLIAALTFVLVSSIIYKKNKSRKGALIGLIAGGICLTLVMIPMNILVTPIFMGVPVEAVKGLLLPAIIPFNAIKAVINIVITFFLYKRISPFLHRW